jgi:hypothetical protein
MIFPKETRKLIHKARHKSVTIDWPSSEPPSKGSKYTVQSRTQEPGAKKVLVLGAREVAESTWEATVRIDSDPVLSLHMKAKRKGGPTGFEDSIDSPTELEPEPIASRHYRRIREEGRQKTALLGATNRQRQKVIAAEQDIRDAFMAGKPTALAEGRRDRALRRLDRINTEAPAESATARTTPERREPHRSGPEGPPLSVDRVVAALSVRGTAQDVASRLGASKGTLRRVVEALNQAQEEGRLVRVVDPEGKPVARWVVCEGMGA